MKIKSNLFPGFHVTAAFALLCVTVSARAEKIADLFTDAGGQSSARQVVDSQILKRRVVRVNLENLILQAGATIQINLFEGTSFQGVVEKVEERSNRDYTLSGHLNADESSSFALAANGEVLAMNVRTKGGDFYQVRYLENGLHEVRQVDETKFPECGTTEKRAVALRPEAKAVADPPQGDAGDIIDVMVVYTAAARTAAGGTSAIQALINLAVSESNTAYQQSLITPRIRLVYQGEVSYTETTDFLANLDRVTNPSDGYLDEVQSLRDTYGADLVSLWIDNSQFCGYAHLIKPMSSAMDGLGFSVVYWDCATGYYSFAHEMGHNMGCSHDRQNGGAGLYSYSYGWRFNGTNGIQYRTIMSYDPGTRVQHFSNPNVNYVGTPTGVPVGQVNESHNAQTINNSAATIANFRQEITATNLPPIIYGQPQSENVYVGDTATFTVAAGGSAPRLYHWRKGGATVSVTTNNSYIIPNVQSSNTNVYSVIVSNAFGIAVSSNATLTIAPPIPLGEALDAISFNWNSGGAAQWLGQSATVHDGTDAGRSGLISNSQESWFETTFIGPGTLTYWCKISSEPGGDLLRFYETGIQQGSSLSGEVDWTQRTINLAEGSHVCRWTYSKNSSGTSGQDRAWVDQVSFVPPGGIALPAALDNAGFSWTTSGNTSWLGQSSTSHDDIDAAQSGAITHSQFTLLETSINGPGSLSFWWKVSSEAEYDFLDFLVDGSTNARLSGDVSWTLKTFSVPAGAHTLGWKYSKDVSDTLGQDKGWVDQIVYSAASSFPAGSARTTNGGFQLQLDGLAGASYTLQASTNLIGWTTLSNMVSSNAQNTFFDSDATNFNARFYRIVSP